MSQILQQPLRLRGAKERWWDIYDANGHSVCSMTAILIDGSRQPEFVATNGVIRDRETSEAQAREVFRRISTYESLEQQLAEAKAQIETLKKATP